MIVFYESHCDQPARSSAGFFDTIDIHSSVAKFTTSSVAVWIRADLLKQREYKELDQNSQSFGSKPAVR